MSSHISYIPFVRSTGDAAMFSEYYSDAPISRVTLDKKRFAKRIKIPDSLWIDIGFDGIATADWTDDENQWIRFINRHGDVRFLTDAGYLEKPVPGSIEKPLCAMLDEAYAEQPGYMTVPQFPVADDVRHNKVNKMLARISADWRRRTKAKIKFIFPLIFVAQKQLNKKTERNPKVRTAAMLYQVSEAEGIWAVDSSLDDQLGSGTFEKQRFPGVIDLFKELKEVIETDLVICGPHWGLNVVLWARGLASHFGIGLGSTYRYYLPGGPSYSPKARVAIPCLRRWAASNNAVEAWLGEGAAVLPLGSPERVELEDLKGRYPALLDQDLGKRQIAEMYRNWLMKIATTPKAGRALALFQDLTSAFVTGKALPDLPSDEGTARRPEKVAQQLMLNCL